MAFLFDTDAISQVFKPRPYPSYLRWLATVPRSEQYTSAISIGELFRGAFRSSLSERHLGNIELRILPAITVLPYDVAVARVYGRIHAQLTESGKVLADADLQIAATAIHHNLELVTGNLRHFERVPGLKIHHALIDAQSDPG
jgi:predicted nucleic acid-binding protein